MHWIEKCNYVPSISDTSKTQDGAIPGKHFQKKDMNILIPNKVDFQATSVPRDKE